MSTELQELQDWNGLEWQLPVLFRLASARGGIARSVLSGEGACGRPGMITGLHAGASGVTPGITGDYSCGGVSEPRLRAGEEPGCSKATRDQREDRHPQGVAAPVQAVSSLPCSRG
jgi:hypothetical protein